MTTTQNTCREIDTNDFEILTGLRLRMSEDYRRKVFFPSMFRFVQGAKDNGDNIQTAFKELSKLTGYKIGYLKNTYYELLKVEMTNAETVDENENPLKDLI